MPAVYQRQQPTPEFFNTVNAYQQTEAMKSAIELEIFTAIAEGCTTAPAVASRCQAAERGVRILCDFLTIHGYLTKDGVHDGLAPDSALFLNRHSPACVGTAIEFPLTPRVHLGGAVCLRMGCMCLPGFSRYLSSWPWLGSPCRS